MGCEIDEGGLESYRRQDQAPREEEEQDQETDQKTQYNRDTHIELPARTICIIILFLPNTKSTLLITRLSESKSEIL